MNNSSSLMQLLKTHTISVAAGAVTALFAQAGIECLPFYQELEKILSKRMLLIMCTLLILLTLLSLYSSYSLKRQLVELSKLKLKFGLLWDRHGNPHCPACRKPLSKITQYTYGIGGYCISCQTMAAVDNSLFNKSLDEIRKLL